MSWNYRVVKKLYGKRDEKGKILEPDSEYNSTSYGIHEVYYDENNKAFMCTQDAVEPFGDTVEELMKCWLMMAEAFNKPILDYDKIPEEGAIDEIKESIESISDENGNIRPTEELIAEGKLISHEVVMKDLRDKINEKAEEMGELSVFEPDYEFDLKEYRNEEIVEQQKSEKVYNENFVDKPLGVVINRIIQKYEEEQEKYEEEPDEDN